MQRASALSSEGRGAGASPSGTRPDFLRQLIDRGGPETLQVMTSFCNVLADGRASRSLTPYLGGACGYAFRKEEKPAKEGSGDGSNRSEKAGVRPVCCGEAWRRVISAGLLATEGDTSEQLLFPHQLAVRVKGGVEVMPHLARQWMLDFAEDANCVYVDFDQSNAHNTVDRAAFVKRVHELVPGLARWILFIYPVDLPTESRSGGQQGDPLMATCHALVQRVVPESLGIVPLLPGSSSLAPTLDPPAQLDALPLYADDGGVAGEQSEVLRCLRHLQSAMPPWGFSSRSLRLFHRWGTART